MKKLSYIDLQNIPNPVSRDFLRYYDKCIRKSHYGREGFVLLGYMNEIWVPKDIMTPYSIKVLNSLSSIQSGGFVLEDI